MKLYSVLILGLLLSLTSYSYGQTQCARLFTSGVPALFLKTAQPLKIKMTSQFEGIAKSLESDKKKKFEATITTSSGKTLKSKIVGIGQSSAYEGDFKKMRVVLEEPYQGVKEFFVITHLMNNPTEKWTEDGRLADGNSPYREALAYDIAQALGVEAPAHRRAVIEYTDAKTKKILTRQALLLENYNDLANRQNGKVLSKDAFYRHIDVIKKGEPNMDVAAGLKAHLFETLIGNTDFFLEVYKIGVSPNERYYGIKNVAIYKQGNKVLPIVYDFDIAPFVVGHEAAALKPWNANPEIVADPRTMEMLKGLLTLRTLFKESELRSELKNFSSQKERLKSIVESSVTDIEGKQIALDHINHFFMAADMMWSPKFKFIQQEKLIFYRTPNMKGNLLKRDKINDRPGHLRIGTPFIILGEERGMLKIVLIDTHNDLLDFNKRIGYIKKDAIISDKIPDDFIPVFDSRQLFQ